MNKLTIVMYHYVRPIAGSKYPKIKGLELDGFRRQLDFLEKNYTLINSDHVILWSRGLEELPANSCYLTFDDGYKDHIDFVLPELISRKLHSAFFPPVKPVVERELLDVNRVHFILAETSDYDELVSDMESLCLDRGVTTQELNSYRSQYAQPNRFDTANVVYIKRMLQHALPESLRKDTASDLFRKYVGINETDFASELYISLEDAKSLVDNGMYVGSHGYKHSWLDRESIDSQRVEIETSLGFLESIGARTENWIMCYPYGAYNADTLTVLKECKCSVGLTTKVGFADLAKDSPLELSRFDTNDFPQ